jgi:intein/homing endonuclease
MFEKLSEEEIEFMEFFHCPVAMVENLFPENINSPSEWILDDVKIVKLRPYQFAMMSYDYLYADDDRKSEKDNVKIKKGAGDLINIASRNIGKCEWTENECQLANGEVVKFKDLINQKAIVLSYNESTMQLEQDLASFYYNGVKPCYKIVLKSGKEIIVTDNHPLLTDMGWVLAKDIQESHIIATPRDYGNIGTIDVDDNVAKILGYIIGDGCCSKKGISFTNINEDIVKEIYELGHYFNCRIRNDDITYYFRKSDSHNKKKGYHSKNEIAEILEKYKIRYKLSKEKELCEEIFKWKNKYIAILLNRLFACDGHYNVFKDGYTNFEITLASKKLIYQIQTLLLRFGIHSDIHYKKSKCGKKYFDAWRLHVGTDCDKLINIIGTKSKSEKLNFVKSYSTSDRIPNEVVRTQIKTVHEKLKTILNDKRKFGYSRNKLLKLCNRFSFDGLTKVANSNIFWDYIKSIEFVGDLQTVVVSVEKNHNYISNNIISHNSYLAVFDACLRVIHGDGDESCVTSFDDKHLKAICEKIANIVENHKFFEMFHITGQKKTVARNPHSVRTSHGHVQVGVNEQVSGKNPGTGFHGLHYSSLNVEEASYMSAEGTKKRIDSGSSLGYIERYSGIPDLQVGSPLGDMLRDKSKKKFICRLPQAVRSDWNEDQKEKMAKEYGGLFSSAFKLNCLGEILEGAEGKYDIERIKKQCWNYDKKIKFFEIDKTIFQGLEDLNKQERIKKLDEILSTKLIIDRLPCERIICSSDIGTTGSPSEVCIYFFINGKWFYEYQISLFKMTVKEQASVFNWFYQKLGSCFISLDCNSAEGRAIRDELIVEYNIPEEHLCNFGSNNNIDIDFIKDANGRLLRDRSGKPQVRTEKTIIWGIQCLEDILYNGKIELPHDEKFLKEFSQYYEIRTGNSVKHGSTTTEHLHDSFVLFALCAWENENGINKNKQRKKRVLGTF